MAILATVLTVLAGSTLFGLCVWAIDRWGDCIDLVEAMGLAASAFLVTVIAGAFVFGIYASWVFAIA